MVLKQKKQIRLKKKLSDTHSGHTTTILFFKVVW